MELPVIFLVDPDVEAAEAVVSHLSAQGWWVSVVQDSDAALRVAAAHAPNLVIAHRRAAPFDGLVEAFSRHAGGPGVILLEIDDETEVPAGADALLPGACDGPSLVAAARQLIREPREAAEELAPVVAAPSVPEPEELSQKFTSVDIFGDMLDTPVGGPGNSSVVELTRVPTPLDGRAGSVTARVHFTGNAAASSATEGTPYMAGVALADLADPVEAQPATPSVEASDRVESQASAVEAPVESIADVAPADLFVEDSAAQAGLDVEPVGVDFPTTDLDAPRSAAEWTTLTEDEVAESPSIESAPFESSDSVHSIEIEEKMEMAQPELAESPAISENPVIPENPVVPEAPAIPESAESAGYLDSVGTWAAPAPPEHEPYEPVAEASALEGSAAGQAELAESSAEDVFASDPVVGGDFAQDGTAPDVAEPDDFSSWLSAPDPGLEPASEVEANLEDRVLEVASIVPEEADADFGSAEAETSEPGVIDGAVDVGAIDLEPIESTSEEPTPEIPLAEAWGVDEPVAEVMETQGPDSEERTPEVSMLEGPGQEEPAQEETAREDAMDDAVIFLPEVDASESFDTGTEVSGSDPASLAGRWFEEGAVDSSGEAARIEAEDRLDEEAAATDLAQFEAIVESRKVEESPGLAPEDSVEMLGDPVSELESVDEEAPSASDAWASVLAGVPADSLDADSDGIGSDGIGSDGMASDEMEELSLEVAPTDASDIEIPESAFEVSSAASARLVGEAEQEVVDLSGSSDEPTQGDTEGPTVEEPSEEVEALSNDEISVENLSVEEELGDDVATQEAARFVFPTSEEPSADHETDVVSETEASEVEAEETATPENESPEADDAEKDDSWTSSGYSFGESSGAEIAAEATADLESPSENDEIGLPAVASSLADPPLPRTSALEGGLSGVAAGANVVSPLDLNTPFDSAADEATPSSTVLPGHEEVQPSTFESLDSGSGRAAASPNLNWLWMVVVVALLAVGGWLWLRNRGEEAALPDSRSPNAPATSAGDGAPASEVVPSDGKLSEPAAASDGQPADSAPVPTGPAPAVDEPKVDSLLDEDFGEREREIRERFEIERKRLEEQLEALRSQRVEDAAGTSRR